MRAVASGSVATLLAWSLGAGCEAPPPTPQTPPFRVQAVGPGIEPNAGGVIVERYGDNARTARVRVGSSSLRVYGGDLTRLGRVRPSAGGYAVARRDGSVACEIVEEGSGGALACGEARWTVGALADGRVEVRSAGGSWTRIAGLPDGAATGWRGERALVAVREDGGWFVLDDGGGAWQIRGTRWDGASAIQWATGLPDSDVLEGSGDLALADAAAAWLVGRARDALVTP